MLKTILVTLFIAALLAGCSAKAVRPQAQQVEITNELPDQNKCRFLGEVVGSQGNWFTGDYTSNKNLVIGARNELRNETYELVFNCINCHI